LTSAGDLRDHIIGLGFKYVTLEFVVSGHDISNGKLSVVKTAACCRAKGELSVGSNHVACWMLRLSDGLADMFSV
jgi:hypothetical protein